MPGVPHRSSRARRSRLRRHRRRRGGAQGIDVSHWQGQIGWLQVGAAGYDFAFAKATEGTTYIDPTYVTNRAGATGGRMRLGAYHFARPAGTSDAAAIASGIAQADHFVAIAQPKRGDLLPVLDLEKTGGLGVARLTTWTQACLDQVYARLGARPLVYASPSFWKTSLGDTPLFAAAGNRLWIAHWTKASLPLCPPPAGTASAGRSGSGQLLERARHLAAAWTATASTARRSAPA